MADVKISTLLVRSEMDSSKYAAGAQQKVTADQAMIKSGNDVKVSVTDTQVKISQAGDVLSRLSRQYVDGFAAAQKFTTALNQLSNGVERGKVNMQQAEAIMDGIVQKYNMMGDVTQFASRGQVEFAAALDRSNAKLREQQFWHQEWLREFNKQPIQRTPQANNQNTLGAFGAFNTGQQLQDIAITAAMGQSIPTIALQQGLQLATSLDIQLQNAKTAGISMASALGGAFRSLISPISLVAIGFTAVAAAAIQYFTSGSEDAKEMNDFLEEQQRILKSLGPEYDAIAKKAKDAFFTPESPGVGQRLLETNQLEAQKLALQQARDAADEFRSQNGLFLRAIQALPAGFQSALGVTDVAVQMDQIIDRMQRGEISAVEAREAIEKLGRGEVLDPLIDRFLKLTTAAAESAQAVQTLTDKQDRLKQGPNFDVGSLFPRMHPEAQLGRNPAELQVEQIRRATELAAELQQINARTIEERVAAARALEEARDIPGELQAERVERANTAATLERARAERELADARRDRQFGREDLISQGQLDLSTVGQTGGEIARMRKEFELMQELREESRRTGVPINEAEAAAVRETAAAYGQLTEAITKKQLASDLAFERSIAGLNAEDEAIARRLHSAGLEVDLGGVEAAMMRQINQIERMKETWQDLFDTVNDGMDSVVDALFEGTDPMEALKKSARELARQIFDLAVTNPLKNFLTGGDFNTIADMGIFGSGASSGRGGGFGGMLGGLFGLDQKLSAMNVQAAVVNINGGIGGAGGILGGLFGGGSAGAEAEFARLVGGSSAAANDNSSIVETTYDAGTSGFSSAEISNRIGLSHNAAFVQPGTSEAQSFVDDWNVRGIISREGMPAQITSEDWNEALGVSKDAADNLSASSEQVTSSFDQVAESGGTLSSTLAQSANSIASTVSSLASGLMGGGGGIPSMFGGGLFSGLSSGFGGILPLAGPADSVGGSLFSGMWHVMHSGGVAGMHGGTHRYASMPTMSLPRYHTGGVAGDEVPAILRRGEPVFRSMDHARQVVGANQNVGAIASQVAKLIQLKPNFIMLDDPQRLGDYVRGDNGNKAIFTEIRRNRMGRDL